MESALKWLKAGYIAGAVADAIVGVLMLIPSRMGEPDFRYAMGLGSVMMFGWSALLIWAYAKPMERKGVLALTVFPVISGLVACGVWAVATGFFPLQRIVPVAVHGEALMALMSIGYLKARKAENE